MRKVQNGFEKTTKNGFKCPEVIHSQIKWTENTVKSVPIQPRGSLPLYIEKPAAGMELSAVIKQLKISPDFSTFLDETIKQRQRRKLQRKYSEGNNLYRGTSFEENNRLDGILNEILVAKRKLHADVGFDEILKELNDEKESPDLKSRSTTPLSESIPEPLFLEEIPLEETEKNDNEESWNKTPDERKDREARNALSMLFDKLLSDLYTGSTWTDEDTGRRASDTKLDKFYKPKPSQLFRQFSQPCCRPGCTTLPPPFTSLSTTFGIIGAQKSGGFQLYDLEDLHYKTSTDLLVIVEHLHLIMKENGDDLVHQLKYKDELRLEQEELCQIITASLQAISNKTSDDARVKFSISPVAVDSSGFQEWTRAMRMVARLPDGVPAHFRKNLWLSLAERHLNSKGVIWSSYEKKLFCETTNAEDQELSVQIVKDLHRTGCSLFCGATGQHNQAVLKKVLLAYARWNKNVGYCQGLNMLAALILQVMQGSQSATVKVMIYLIEGVLPESYFANNLRGLSVDMAVFRDLLRLRLPVLASHLAHLQTSTAASVTTLSSSNSNSSSYEPPLCDVFTMQWFLTLFSNCLPQSTVLRVWDLVFLEGDSVVLRTSLAVWQCLSDRLMAVKSADEFYSIMAVLTREMMEFGLMEPNSLIRAIDSIEIPEMTELREKYTYNISPWAVGTVARMGVKLLYPDSGGSADDLHQKEQKSTPYSNHPDREKIALDISALKKQYWKLRERQRQAHIILSACRSDTLSTSSSPAALNHLLLGKTALLTPKGRRIIGTIPEPVAKKTAQAQTSQWERPESVRKERRLSPCPSQSSSSSSSTELCDSSDSSDSDEESPIVIDEEDGAIGGQEFEDTVFTDGKDDVGEEERAEAKPRLHSCSEYTTTEEELSNTSSPKESSLGRRKSELALLQILQENSKILRRIHLNAKKSLDEDDPSAKLVRRDEQSTAKMEEETNEQPQLPNSTTSKEDNDDEPEDIKEIRRRWAQSAT